jgi:ATP/maltotriose-dependent transcriptional regulator MalT
MTVESSFRLSKQYGMPNLIVLPSGSALRAHSYRQTIRPDFGERREWAVVQHKLLSARETEILRRVSRGLSNQEIADQLSITVGTTKGHLHRIFGKLDVRNRTAAVARARELGLL